MKTVEERLQEHKHSIQTIQAPSGLEERLRNALERVPAKRSATNRSMMVWAIPLAAALLLMVGAYQYPAFAYYGAKLFNKMELNSLSFAEMAEQGYGQEVGKSRTLDDGTVITINGVISDDNALLLYYTINRPSGSVFIDNSRLRYGIGKLEGFLTDSEPKEGNGYYSKDGRQYEGVYKFEPVSPFSRTLTITFRERLDDGGEALYPISFKFKANKAMNSLIKQDISQSVAVDRGTVHYDSITASPTSTIVKGHYELEDEWHPRFPGTTRLYVNGMEVQLWGMRSDSSSLEGKPGFQLEYDVIPTDKVETLELVLENFSGYQKVEAPVALASPSDHPILIGDQKIWIRSVTRTEKGYDIVIARKQFVQLERDRLFVQAGGSRVAVSSISMARQWDLRNGNILWEQTYSFDTKEEPEWLLLDGIHYIKTYGTTISIPVDAQK